MSLPIPGGVYLVPLSHSDGFIVLLQCVCVFFKVVKTQSIKLTILTIVSVSFSNCYTFMQQISGGYSACKGH